MLNLRAVKKRCPVTAAGHPVPTEDSVMQTTLDCYPCLLRQALQTARFFEAVDLRVEYFDGNIE